MRLLEYASNTYGDCGKSTRAANGGEYANANRNSHSHSYADDYTDMDNYTDMDTYADSNQYTGRASDQDANQDANTEPDANKDAHQKRRITLWRAIPKGLDARHVVTVYTFFLMLGRFGLTVLTSPGSAARINVFPAWQYGIAFLLLFAGLLYTQNVLRRLTLAGFTVSVCGCALYMVQAIDVYPVFPSDAFYALMGIILFAESVIIARTIYDH